MEIYTEGNKCCRSERNILETDGTHVCTQCGKVQDMICFGNFVDSYQTTLVNPYLLEVCYCLELVRITKNHANLVLGTLIRQTWNCLGPHEAE